MRISELGIKLGFWAVAEQALKDWYSTGCAPLSEYLYFEAGDNRENEFRKEFSK